MNFSKRLKLIYILIFFLFLFCFFSFNNQDKSKSNILNVGFLGQKYPYFYCNKQNLNKEILFENFNGFEYIILKELSKINGFSINLNIYDKTQNYDIIVGGVIYSKQIEQIFNSYIFINYFNDTISVYSLKKNNFNIKDFKTSDEKKIGFIMYSYAYYLLKQYLPKARIYAYKDDMIKDLMDEKIYYIVIDDNFFEIPDIYKEKIIFVGTIYEEKIGLLLNKSRNDLKDKLINVISRLNFKEILTWLK